MNLRRILAGFSVAPVLLLTACGGNSSSIANPPVSSGPTKSATTDPSVPVWTFVSDWIREDRRMQNTGETGRFRSLNHHCSGCDAVADKMNEIYGAGGFVRTQGLRVVAHHESAHAGTHHTIELNVVAAPTTFRLRTGGSLMHFKGGPEHFQLELVRSAGSWLVTRFVQVAS